MNDATKIKILSKFLNTKYLKDAILDDHLVLTDRQATKAAKEYILETLWAFNADFILSHSKIDMEAKYLTKIQGVLGESANTLIRGMIANINQFIKDAIAADGRGHFMSSYDGREHEFEYKGKIYYIYKIN